MNGTQKIRYYEQHSLFAALITRFYTTVSLNRQYTKFTQRVSKVLGLDECEIRFVLSDNTVMYCITTFEHINQPETMNQEKIWRTRCVPCAPLNHLFKPFVVLTYPSQAAFKRRKKKKYLRFFQ